MNREKKGIDWNKRWEILNQKINNMKEIDWTKVKSGDRFTAKIEGVKCEGKIHIGKNAIYLCQNMKDGDNSPNKQGYPYSWNIGNGSQEHLMYHWINVRNLKIISQTKKPMATTRKNPSRKIEYAFISYQTVGKAEWELYAYHDANNEKVSSFKKDGKKYTGNFCYGNRLVSTANGNILTGNKGFNTKQAAYKNVLLVGKVSGLIAGVTVKNGKRVDAVKSVKKKSTKA